MVISSPLAGPEAFQGLKGLIFDCDGVLVNSLDANRMYYNMIREHLGLLPMTPEEEVYVHMHAVLESVAHIVPAERFAEAEAFRKTISYRDMFAYTFLEPGLEHLLSMLRDQGYRLAVNTNRTDSMEALLEEFGLERFFSPVITAAKVSHPKPNPEGVSKILRAWDVDRHQVAYLGDSSLDERTARAAGVRFWAYKNPKLSAQVHVTDFDSLRLCLQKAKPAQ